MTKILLVTDNLSRSGGAEIYDKNLLQNLKLNGYITEYLTPSVQRSSVVDYFLSWYNPIFNNQFSKKCSEFDPDVIFTHNILSICSPSFLTVAHKLDIPVIYKAPNITKLNKPELSIENIYRILTNRRYDIHKLYISKYATSVIAQSDYIYNMLQEFVPTSKIHRIDNPTFLNVSNPKDRIQLPVNLIYVGRITREKGVMDLLDAYKIFQSTYNIKSHLEIYGDGPLKRGRKFSNIVESNSSISYNGFIEHNELAEAYYSSDISILPSRVAETFGMTIVESMSQGTPVITTNIGAQQEHISHRNNGSLVDPGSPKQISAEIHKLISNNQKYRNKSKNCISYAKKHTLQKHMKQIEALFNQII